MVRLLILLLLTERKIKYLSLSCPLYKSHFLIVRNFYNAISLEKLDIL